MTTLNRLVALYKTYQKINLIFYDIKCKLRIIILKLIDILNIKINYTCMVDTVYQQLYFSSPLNKTHLKLP